MTLADLAHWHSTVDHGTCSIKVLHGKFVVSLTDGARTVVAAHKDLSEAIMCALDDWFGGA